MKLIYCRIENFGRLRNFEYSFSDGVNALCRENGWGKSTFAAFLCAMFYGLPGTVPGRAASGNTAARGTAASAPGRGASPKSMRSPKNERAKYLPWQGGVFGGKLVFEAGGKEYEMTRIFGKRPSEDIFDLLDTDTDLPSFDYSEKIGEELFHLDRESFMRTVFTAQQDCETQATDDVNALIGDLAGRAGDMGCYEDARKRLVEAANRLTPKRPTGALYRRGARIAELTRRVKQDRDAAPEEKLGRCFVRRAQAQQKIAALEAGLLKGQEELRQAEEAFEKASRSLDFAMSGLYASSEEASPSASPPHTGEPREASLTITAPHAEEPCAASLTMASPHAEEPCAASLTIAALHAEEPRAASPSAPVQILLSVLILVLGTALLAGGIPVFLFVSRAAGAVLMASGTVFALAAAAAALSGLPKGSQKGPRREIHKSRAGKGIEERIKKEKIKGEKLKEEKLKEEKLKEEKLKEEQKAGLKEDKEVRLKERPEDTNADRIIVQEAHRQYLISRRMLESKKAEIEEGRHRILTCRSGLDELESEIAELTELAEEKEESEGLLRELREKQETDEAAYRHVMMAEAFLRKAKESMTSRYSDPIRRNFAAYWERITGYSAAGISVDANTSVTIQELGRRRSSGELSRGYGDLAGICLRTALADAMYPPGRGEKPPLILDDPFTNLDDEKTRGALRFLNEIGEKYQILYLTCSESRIGPE